LCTIEVKYGGWDKMNISRRTFVSGIASAFAVTAEAKVAGAVKEVPSKLRIKKYNVKIGLKKPFTVLHISDTHLAFFEMVDGKPYPPNSVQRNKWATNAKDALLTSFAHARERGQFVVHTGDLIDYVGGGSVEVAGECFKEMKDGLIVPGNHEYILYIGDRREGQEKYVAEMRSKVQPVFPDNMLLSSRVVNGVNFVGINTVTYCVPPGVPEMFEYEAARGYPIVLCCHIPFYTEGVYKAKTRGYPTRSAYLCGLPDEKLNLVKDLRKRKMQKADKRTFDFIERLKREPNLKAILSGHLHLNHVSDFKPGVPQFCIGTNFEYHAEEITFS
jgi:hypothetical protein